MINQKGESEPVLIEVRLLTSKKMKTLNNKVFL